VRRVRQAPPSIKSHDRIGTRSTIPSCTLSQYHIPETVRQASPSPMIPRPSGSFIISPFHIITRRSPLFVLSNNSQYVFPFSTLSQILRSSIKRYRFHNFLEILYRGNVEMNEPPSTPCPLGLGNTVGG